ncbi:hypothetical protein [Clostridium algidicarnis]|uniref:hypothetical protein n=1 Tax=Clostridium algidicarnis TaxID=37659 RepID=UPI001C0DE5CA|nr:hypothetical protein [Clostridium algidicarnis]MBU3203126.1 hypothetical protein [Clostridium algidicarnis]MBU3211280.1 hypothetical protein [Clostridium algidicarnis]MBU3222212.1 hypothetical protein [Clostridium algidicarnis]
MDSTAEKILNNAYFKYLETKRSYLCQFPTSSVERHAYNEAIDYLKDNGYITIGRRAVGMADVILTEYGIDFIKAI